MIKICKQTGQQFEISDSDLAFYKKMGVPPPTLCPDARHQRRTAFRNERSLYKRKCSATGASIIGVYSEEAVFPVYSLEYWWSDSWDPREYGKDFDFNRPFFEQYKELMDIVPRFPCSVSNSVNCEYNNFCSGSKNCYMSQRLGDSEDAYYTYLAIECKDVYDCYNVSKSQICYEVIDGENCYNVKYSQNVTNCSDSNFLFNCRDCRDCFMCVNLRNGRYAVRNKTVSKEEYENVLKEFNESNDKAKYIQEMSTASSKVGVPEIWGTKLENVSGNYLSECKNVFESYDCRSCEDVKFSWGHIYGEDCMDTNFGFHCNQCYEFIGGSKSQELRFCFNILEGSSNLTYCMDCMNNSSDLFGCISMKHGKHCILNKQYTKEEYEELVPKIIEHMKKTGEWGEFFPMSLSPFKYEETVANEYFPKEEKLKKNRSFTLIEKEKDFYKKHMIPLPTLHPDERHQIRVNKRAPRKLFESNCQKCTKPIKTSYTLSSPEKVYCQSCYLEAIY